MIEPADPAKFANAARNRTFILGFLCGAVVAGLLAFVVQLAPARTDTPAPGQTGPASTGNTPIPQPTNPGSPQTSPRLDLARRIADDPLAMGSPDAPVVLIEYADYRCPFCAKFEQDTLPSIVEEYVNTGLVRVEFRDMPVFGEQSMAAAIAGRAAGAQGRFWEFLSAIAANGIAEGGHPDLPRERLVSFAQQAGVPDIERFAADLDSSDYRTAVLTDLAEGRRLGLSSVPAFLIGHTGVLGAHPIDVFRGALDNELTAAGVQR